MTEEAFPAMRNVLQAHGVLVINSFGNLQPGHDFLTASLDKTLKRVFRSVRIHTAGSGNVFFVASEQPKLVMYRQVRPGRGAPDLPQAGGGRLRLYAGTGSEERHRADRRLQPGRVLRRRQSRRPAAALAISMRGP